MFFEVNHWSHLTMAEMAQERAIFTKENMTKQAAEAKWYPYPEKMELTSAEQIDDLTLFPRQLLALQTTLTNVLKPVGIPPGVRHIVLAYMKRDPGFKIEELKDYEVPPLAAMDVIDPRDGQHVFMVLANHGNPCLLPRVDIYSLCTDGCTRYMKLFLYMLKPSSNEMALSESCIGHLKWGDGYKEDGRRIWRRFCYFRFMIGHAIHKPIADDSIDPRELRDRKTLKRRRLADESSSSSSFGPK